MCNQGMISVPSAFPGPGYTFFFQNDALSFETGDRDWCVSQRRLIRVIAGNGESCVSNTTNIFLVHWTQNCRQEHFPQLKHHIFKNWKGVIVNSFCNGTRVIFTFLLETFGVRQTRSNEKLCTVSILYVQVSRKWVLPSFKILYRKSIV